MSLAFDVVLIAAAIPAHLFCVHYLWATRRVPRRGVRGRAEGWHMITFTASLALIFDVLLMPDFPWRRGVLLALLACVAGALWWRYAFLLAAIRSGRSGDR